MFLSVPLTMTAQIALDSSARTRWMAVLLGPEDAVDPDAPATSDAAASPAEQVERHKENLP